MWLIYYSCVMELKRHFHHYNMKATFMWITMVDLSKKALTRIKPQRNFTLSQTFYSQYGWISPLDDPPANWTLNMSDCRLRCICICIPTTNCIPIATLVMFWTNNWLETFKGLMWKMVVILIDQPSPGLTVSFEQTQTCGLFQAFRGLC